MMNARLGGHWPGAALSLLSIFSLVGAESVTASCSGDISFTSTSYNFGHCSTWYGSITVQAATLAALPSTATSLQTSTTALPTTTSASTNVELPPSTPGVTLDGLVQLNGDLVFDSIVLDAPSLMGPSPMFTISMGGLQHVEKLSFNNMKNLVFPNMQDLMIVEDLGFSDVDFYGFPDFNDSQLSVSHAIKTVYFSGTNVRQINLGSSDFGLFSGEFAAAVTAVNNPDLRVVTLVGYSGVHTELTIQGNPNVSITSDMTAGTLTLDNVASLELASLTSVIPMTMEMDAGDDSQFIKDSTLQSLSLPALQSIQSAFEIANNPGLSSLVLSDLASISTLKIDNNNNLLDVSFPNLSNITALLIVSGPVDSVSLTLPKGGFEGKVEIDVVDPGSYSCPQTGLSNAKYHCTTGLTAPLPTATASNVPVPTASSGSSGKGIGGGGLSKGAKIGIGVGVGVGAALIIFAIAFFCITRHRRSQSSPRSVGTGDYTKSELSGPGSSGFSYDKVPYEQAYTATRQHEPQQYHRAPSSNLGDDWAPPEQAVPSREGRVELEEQQRPRHEMDARSLPDIDMGDSDEEDRRSLEDIERVHNQRLP